MDNKETLADKIKKTDDIIPKVIAIGVVGTAAVLSGYLLIKKIIDDDKESKKTQSLILIDNGDIVITEDTDKKIKSNVKDEKYSIVFFDDQHCLVSVYCLGSQEYAKFIASNVYFTDDNKIVFDILNITDEKYEYFIENINELCEDKSRSRVRRG